MQSQFVPKKFAILLQGEGEIKQIQSDETYFLNLPLSEYKNTSLLDWTFELQRETVKHFLFGNPTAIPTHNHLGVWLTNKKHQYFWCIIYKSEFKPEKTENLIIIYDYTHLLPQSNHLFLIHPHVYYFLHQLPIPIGITNVAGYWVDANPALCSLFGYTKEELVKCTWQELTLEENLDQELSFFREAIREPSYLFDKLISFEKFYFKKDRSVFRALVHLLPIPEKENDTLYGFFVCIENLDEKEAQQKEAEETKHFLRLVLDLLPVRVFWKDKDLHYLGCNLAFAKDAGKKSPEEIIGLTDYDLPWKPEAELYRKDDREVIQSGKPKIFYEEPQTTPDGKQIWLRTSKIPLFGAGGTPYGVLGIYEDITELKSMINTLNETMSLLKTIIDSAPIGIIGINGDRNIDLWNNTSKEILGWDIEEVFSKPVKDFIPEIYKHISSCRDTHPSSEIEVDERNRNGELLTLRVIHRVIRLSNEESICLVLFRDITEIKKVQQEQELFQKQLQHTQKLESLGVLSSSIAHDFNNFLMAIMGHVELAKEEVNNPTAVKNYLISMEEAINSAGDLCRQLLIFSGKKQQPYQPCDISQLIKEMEHLLKVSISKKVVLEMDLASNLPLIDGEIGQLRSVVLNLVINASDAIGNRSGIIRIKTGTIDITESYLRTTWFQDGIQPKKYVFLEVADNGCGMSQETLSKIFDPFFTTKEHGRGLGLSTIMGILRAHNGTIKVYSEEGKGSTFKLFFPALEEKSEVSEKLTEDMSSWKGKGVVLLADDEPVVLQVTTKMLQKLGLEVIPAKDGREALELFQKNKDRISALILDITMPHLDGTVVARQVRSEFPDIPIFLSTGFSKHTFDENDINFPIQGFLSKPYNINTLIKNLRDYL